MRESNAYRQENSGSLNILAVLSILGNALVFAVDQVTGQLIYDYVADPAVIIAIFLTVLVNLGDSLRKRDGSGNRQEQLPRDVITALVAMLGFRYLLQYIDKMAAALEPVPELWHYLVSAAVVVLIAEAISLWRFSGQEIED